MKSVNITELKNRLKVYLNDVKAGEEILVRDRNQPVARIVPLVRSRDEDGELLALAAQAAFANFHLFQVEQLFSNADGTVQFIVMHEFAGMNGENLWMGNMLTSTHAGVAKQFMFNKDLPGGSNDPYGYGMMASPTANAGFCSARADYA